MLMNPFGGESDTTKANDDSRHGGDANRPNGIARGQTIVESRPPMHSTFSFAESESSPSPSRTSRSSFFAEPETTNSLSAGSREGSLDGKRLGKNRPKTQFSVCHAPPESRARQRLHRRPRSLLQLHRLRDAARPMPAFEVIPSTNFSLTLNAAITRVFKTKHGLCPSDLVVLQAEKYSAPSDEEDEDKEVRDVIGLICKGRKDDDKQGGGRAKIVMADGKVWEAYPINKGGYEFYSVDKNGLALTVRWVPKRNKDGSNVGKDGLKRFNFSTISPNTRRHPVIASLSKTALDINDSYKLPNLTSIITPLGTPNRSSTILEDAMDDENDRLETDPHLRELITITSIFVTFKEGWSPSFKYDDKDHISKFGPHSPTKSLASPIVSPPVSPALAPRHNPLEKRASIKSVSSDIIRRTSFLNKSNRNSIISNSDDEHHFSPSRSSSVAKPGRSRADSSSTVLVHRAASNRRKNNQQWRPDLLGTRLTVQETSKEDLGRMSLSKNRSIQTPSPLAGAAVKGRPAPTSSRHSSMDKKEEYHQGSVTTTASVPGSPSSAAKKTKKAKKPSRWRGLFCGSRDGD